MPKNQIHQTESAVERLESERTYFASESHWIDWQEKSKNQHYVGFCDSLGITFRVQKKTARLGVPP